ncbi:MAG: hypothetical protein NVSMB25_20550 [Thermoleophilaceae bacterium]
MRSRVGGCASSGAEAVSEDRFGDLGPADERRHPSAGERLAELDALEEPAATRRQATPAPRRGPGSRYTWVLGIAAVILIVVIGIRSVPHAGLGTHGPTPGQQLIRFAAPNALGSIDADPNVKQSTQDRSAPNRTVACQVRGAGVVNLCDLERRPLVLTFIGPGTAEAERYLDRIESLSRGYPQASFAAVVSLRSRHAAAALVRAHGWTFPVAVDRSALLFNAYHVALVPTTSFVYRGGTVRETRVLAQNMSDAQLAGAVRAAIAGRTGG